MKSEANKCLQCPIAGICNSDIPDSDIPEKIRMKAVAYALGLPLVAMLAAFAIVWLSTGSQLWSAIAALFAPACYYSGFYIYRSLHCS